jgi:hypothetical protein
MSRCGNDGLNPERPSKLERSLFCVIGDESGGDTVALVIATEEATPSTTRSTNLAL